MKVLFVLDNYFPFIGGAEILFKHVCEGLAGKGHEVTVVTNVQPGAPLYETINGVAIHRIRTPHFASRYWFAFLSIPRAMKLAGSFDIIHTTTYTSAFAAWLSARLKNRKCIINVHEVIGEGWKSMMGMNWFMAWLHQLLERIIVVIPFDHYISVSAYTAGRIHRYGVKQGKVSVVYPGIDYEMFDPHKADGKALRAMLGLEDKFIYISYGRPGISKGLEYLVRAVPLIAEKIPGARLLMILGKMPEDGYRKITGMVKEMGLEGSVTILDPVPRAELPSYIAASDCVVVPSISEGFGFTASEACAMGKPVVASNVASLPEVISGAHMLVQPADPASIAAGVEAVYNKNAMHTAEKRFLWPDCVDAYEKIYFELTGLKP
jgi:glycosyltransferase involved in cell wall biosynthesis